MSVVADLQSAIVQNPSLHVLSANGYFDLATGFYATEYLLNHMALNADQRKRLHYAYFNSGHEVYLNHDALVQFKAELVRFYRAAGGSAETSHAQALAPYIASFSIGGKPCWARPSSASFLAVDL